MGDIGDLLSTAGFFGIPICLVLLIINVVTKTPKKKALTGLAVCFAAFVLGFIMMIEGSLTENTTEPVNSPELIASPEPTQVTDTAEPTPVSATEIMAQIEAAAKGQVDYFSIEGDETGITVSLAMNGIAEELLYASSLGYDETYEPWASNREALLNLYFLFEELIADNGREDIVLMVNLVNDTNYDNCLLSAYRGEIVYDELAIRSGHADILLKEQTEEPVVPDEGADKPEKGFNDGKIVLISVAVALGIVFVLMVIKNLPPRKKGSDDSSFGSAVYKVRDAIGGDSRKIVSVKYLGEVGARSKRGGLGGALLGGFLFGPLGAPIGAFSQKGAIPLSRFAVKYENGDVEFQDCCKGSRMYDTLMSYVSWEDL
ncbi:MAG: hypothetical protein ACI4IW_06505 [Oscillospiraceae bacterium]